MLRAGEKKIKLDCGCGIYSEISTVFNYCPLHYAAPDLLAQLKEARNALAFEDLCTEQMDCLIDSIEKEKYIRR